MKWPPRWRWSKWLAVTVFGFVAVAAIGGGVLAILAYKRLGDSLPALDGHVSSPSLSATVRIERDADGVPSIWAENRVDAAYALGFLHAQERYFQMDLGRHAAAGELAELFGAGILPIDRDFRRHRFRALATRVLGELPVEQRELVHAYTLGVNEGLRRLGAPPFEYGLLALSPQPWREEDTLLSVFYMYLLLQDSKADQDYSRAALYDALPRQVADFLAPTGSHDWDAPLVGPVADDPPLPPAQVLDLRQVQAKPLSFDMETGRRFRGSNAWAVGGGVAAGDGALVANDMHLAFAMPNVFYRAAIMLGATGDRLVGVTLPGFPLLIAGSNGHVAWGLTNSAGEWSDLVRLDQRGLPADQYRVPAGVATLTAIDEVLHVRGGANETLRIEQTTWGPVMRHRADGALFAELWIAHFPQAVNLGLLGLERARSLDEAMAAAPLAGVPTQNLVVGDIAGNVGWTLLGPAPRRAAREGGLPSLSSREGDGWSGWLAPSDYPRVQNPGDGRIWSANARVGDGNILRAMGHGYYILGARAGQIRDALRAAPRFDENTMAALQLDDRALFLSRWRGLLLETLKHRPPALGMRTDEAATVVTGSSDRADADAAGYRLVREFRLAADRLAFAPFVGLVAARFPDFKFDATGNQREDSLWRLVTERPAHLLNPRFATWDALLEAAAAEAVTTVAGKDAALSSRPWGEANLLAMRHPMSPFFPFIGHFLDMPPSPLSGDENMPLAELSSHGPVLRLVVSPGHEDRGFLTMPGGQSANPRSPYYGAGHDAWRTGHTTPLLPGPPTHTLWLDRAARARTGGRRPVDRARGRRPGGSAWLLLVLLGLALTPKPAAAATSPSPSGPTFSGVMPPDLRSAKGGAPDATLDEAALYAWQEFIALNWPAKAGKRGTPDIDATFDSQGQPRVWETLRGRVEAYPGVGSPSGGADGTQDYGFDKPPRYIYDPAKVGTPAGQEAGTTAACDPGAAMTSPPWHNLDEPDHGNAQSGLSPAEPFPGRQILLESKVNREHFVYVASRGWYGDKPLRLIKRRTGDYVRTAQEAPPAAKADDPSDETMISFPSGALELKAAWRRLGPLDDPDHYFTSRVRFYQLGKDGLCHQDSKGGPGDTWGLLAFHVMHKTPSAPYFIWATFEQVDTLIAPAPGPDGKPVPLENPDGTLAPAAVALKTAYSPEIKVTPATLDEDQEIRFASADPAEPGLQLFYNQVAEFGLPRIDRIAINRRLYPTPAAIAAVNRRMQAELSAHYPNLPLAHYRLVSVQWRPVDKKPGEFYDGPEEPAVYYASNVVIEPAPVQQAFSGQFTSGFAKASDYLHRTMLFINPKPNPGDPAFLNSFFAGHGTLSGGCMGCHGFRQAYGTDWSFLLERQRVLAPEVKP
ncbi:acyl-homoserine lactone acylase PvdQ [Nitrospirillum amazonense]|uniref:Acyl-homoserine lactone acylase PvdQ n=1 Tax=Nitrospirillum amazonense TaxID=28077 RepID=A0A560ESQ1_9PROT|nr:penicillin acylase family protein [Nitrospirillum amazonense]TWB12398.1 acyl-homoserine lactone acylase PvdQ [Nitrospirillum amazonense]